MGTKEDIFGGLKQALARGFSLQQAKQSFINAGYSSQEVNEAASSIDERNVRKGTRFKPLPSPSGEIPPPPQNNKQKTQKSSNKMIIILLSIFLILLAFLIISLVFKDQIIDFLSRLFSTY